MRKRTIVLVASGLAAVTSLVVGPAATATPERQAPPATVVIFAAAYLLWAIQRILFNPLDKPENQHIPDLNRRELALMIPLIAGIVWLGVYPAPVLRRMETAATRFVQQVELRASRPMAEGQR